MLRLTTPATKTRYTLARPCFSTSGSAPAAGIASHTRAFGVAVMASGVEAGMTKVPGAGTDNLHGQIGRFGNKYGGYALLIM
jgi:hypothetical protein